jgi:hypothetical protein
VALKPEQELLICERVSICDRKNKYCCGFPHVEGLACYFKDDPLYSTCMEGRFGIPRCVPLGPVVVIQDERLT